MFLSIKASTVDLFINVFNNIKVIYTEVMLIRSKHLRHCNVVRSTSHLSTSSSFDSIALNSVLFNGTRSRTRPNRSYMKPCMYRSPNSSLLKGDSARGRGLKEVSRVRHLSCKCRLLL